jgi:hypothetical protein
MNGNIAKHLILKTVINWGGDGVNSSKSSIIKKSVLWMTALSYNILLFPKILIRPFGILSPKTIKKSILSRNYTYLIADGYLGVNKENGLVKSVYITEKGIAAVSSEYFIVKNKESIGFLFRDIVALIVAIATVYALVKPDDSSKKMQDILLMQQQMHKSKLKDSMELIRMNNRMNDLIHFQKNLHGCQK